MKQIKLLSLLGLTALLMTSCGGTSKIEEKSSPNTPSESTSVEKNCIEDDKVHIVVLAGQSGARGKALVADLEEEEKAENPDIDFAQDGLMMPQLNNIPETVNGPIIPLKAGFGDAGGEFGPELGIGQTLASRYPKNGSSRRAMIVKYTACGSTFTDHWYSTSSIDDDNISDKLNMAQIRTNAKTEEALGPLTNNLYQLIDNTVATLKKEGFETVIDGIVFSHGEQDAKYDKNMEIYEAALKNFITDTRKYLNNDKIPFVITEAITNGAKHSEKLKEIQKKVSTEVDDCIFVSSAGLHTNTFEPWHLGARSNMELGNRAASEIIALNDSRTVKSFEEKTIKVPYGIDVELPKYINATFNDDSMGMMKVTYKNNYDKNKKGIQTVEYVATTACKVFKGNLSVNVCDEPFIDGKVVEYSNVKENKLPNDLGSVYVVKGEEGIYISAKINDKDIWTDGEAWHTGDMGQKDLNDDFRIYLTESDLTNRFTICLSAANLLRVYGEGKDLTQGNLQSDNLIYKKLMFNYDYRASAAGTYNSEGTNSSNGMEVEVFIGYDDLGIEDPNNIKLCFNYNNVTSSGGKKSNIDNFLCKGSVTADAHKDIANYFNISELI